MDQPIFFDKPIPETQLSAPNYPVLYNPILGKLTFTSGFMESTGHGYKSSPMTAIYRDGSVRVSQPGNYNIGTDETIGYGSQVLAWYSGVVTKAGREGNYGNRIHIKCDFPFNWQGKDYSLYIAYGHCSKLLKSVGERVSQGEPIAIEAGQGATSSRNYGSHIDTLFHVIEGDKIIAINPDFVALQLPNQSRIEKISVLSLDDEGNAVKWLQALLRIPINGLFGSRTKLETENFQKKNNLYIDGIVGEVTGRKLGMIGYGLIANKSTVLKRQPVQSSTLKVDEVYAIIKDELVTANWIQDKGNHWLIEVLYPINGFYNWYAFKEHFSVVKGYDSEVEENDLLVSEESVWDKALRKCPTMGCSPTTARPEGFSSGGVETSHKIAFKDWSFLKPDKLEIFKEISVKFDIPVAVMLGLASRESHIGAILGQWGNVPGWGDKNNAFGIFQVDKRFHEIVGKNDPFSPEHIRQAMGIFADYRSQVRKKHPDWSLENVLKGACVAYQ